MRPTCGHPELYALMTRYEMGAVSADERAAFERHVLECDACFVELERGAAVMSVLREQGTSLAQALGAEAPAAAPTPPGPSPPLSRALRDGLREAAPERVPGRRWRLGVPALAAGLVLASAVLVERANRPDLPLLATFPRDGLRSATMRAPGAGDAVRDLLDAGAAYYELQQYDEALRRFRAARQRDPESAEAAYALGLALAVVGAVEEAVTHLESATRLTRGDDQRQARWVLANAHLRARQAARARALLQELALGEDEIAARARALLQRMPR